ncbi:hypothetical protein HanLR1_Chr01g0023831 [Helianthus annuus]|nr:hypothetical protein HanHA89_Chr01g0025271 [Helianthus annuus]KAJ0783737.1 hypothetical protein HanLR1_Chr01g0023831 [Helianthus annuus]
MAGAFFSACNLWCSHDSLRPLSEPYRAGFEMIKQYCRFVVDLLAKTSRFSVHV